MEAVTVADCDEDCEAEGEAVPVDDGVADGERVRAWVPLPLRVDDGEGEVVCEGVGTADAVNVGVCV